MRIVKIAESLTRIGEQLTCVHGTLTTIYKQDTGSGQYGPWTRQSGTLRDETGSIAVTFWNQRDFTKMKGMKMTISAKEGDRGVSGILVEENTYEDKKTQKQVTKIQLKVTEPAFIDCGTSPITGDAASGGVEKPQSGSAIPLDADEEERKALETIARKKAERLKAEAETKARAQSEEKSDAEGSSNYPMAKKRIIQVANLYSYALRSAKWALAKHGLEIKDVYTSAATLFIAMRDDKLTDSMPMALMNDEKPVTEDYYPSKRLDPAEQPDPIDDTDQEPASWRDVAYNGIKLGDTDPVMLEFLFNTFKPKLDPATGNYKMQDLYVKNALITWKKENS